MQVDVFVAGYPAAGDSRGDQALDEERGDYVVRRDPVMAVGCFRLEVGDFVPRKAPIGPGGSGWGSVVLGGRRQSRWSPHILVRKAGFARPQQWDDNVGIAVACLHHNGVKVFPATCSGEQSQYGSLAVHY